jgi:hypothetical protein
MRVPVILILLVGGSLALTGCGQRKVVSSSMSADGRDALDANLATLETTLENKSPFVFAKLAPGATPEEIVKLRSELGGAQIECLEIWFRWHNGCTDRLTDVLPLGRMISIDEALKDRQAMQSVPFVDAKRLSALKILDDAAGDGFFLDVTSANPRVFYHMLEDPFPRDYGTLAEFVAFIREVHDAEIVTQNEHGMAAFDLDRYQEIETAYLRRVGADGE